MSHNDKECTGCRSAENFCALKTSIEVEGKILTCPCITCIVKPACRVECDKYLEFFRHSEMLLRNVGRWNNLMKIEIYNKFYRGKLTKKVHLINYKRIIKKKNLERHNEYI